jgi:hypothetical protein
VRVWGTYDQSKSRGADCNESGAKSDKCGAVPTVDVALSPAGRKPPPDESSCDEGDHGQDGHFIDPQSL